MAQAHDGGVGFDAVYGRYRGVVDDWDGFLGAMEAPLAPCIRANTLRLSRDELMRLLRQEGYRPRPVAWNPDALEVDESFRPGRHWGFLAGLFQPQEAASMVPVAALAPTPGERVLDLCAAPGNKTLQLAGALDHRGTVIANDVNQGRVGTLGNAVKRHGALNVAQTVRDGQGLPWQLGSFDRVVVDAPCSCEGTYRKTAAAAEPTAPEMRERLAAVQQRLLERAVRLTRPGGTVVYATCTFAPEENEAVVAAVIARRGGEVEVLPARVPGLTLAPGLEAWAGRRFGAEMAQCGRLWPHANDTGGFFVAVLRRSPWAELSPKAWPEPDPVAPDATSRRHWDDFLEHFGLDPETDCRGVTPFSAGRRYVQVAAADHAPPEPDARVQAGIPAVGVQARPPKPTTAAALAFGARARRHVVEVTPGEADAYLRREAIQVEPERRPAGEGPSFVLVRYRGYALGVGEHRQGRIASLFPKAWLSGARATPQISAA